MQADPPAVRLDLTLPRTVDIDDRCQGDFLQADPGDAMSLNLGSRAAVLKPGRVSICPRHHRVAIGAVADALRDLGGQHNRLNDRVDLLIGVDPSNIRLARIAGRALGVRRGALWRDQLGFPGR